MTGRHRPPRTKRALRQRAQALAADLERSESARETLMKSRNDLLDQVRSLTGQLNRLRLELGTEEITVPVQVVATGHPVMRLKPPETGSVPLQRPGGTRAAVRVGGSSQGLSQGRTEARRPKWATG